MNVLIDTNIALDVMLNRVEFYSDSAQILLMSEKRIIDGYISASAITDIYYFIQKEKKDKTVTLSHIKALVKMIHIATVTNNEVTQAIALEWDDFEDSIQYTVGESINAQYIITRNPKDYEASTIPVIMPAKFIQLVKKVNN
ncbi:twitching motility protein PilT [Spirochaetia bacterium]|nr:twitching motility protein PilT [Spirochaetia bacterium]